MDEDLDYNNRNLYEGEKNSNYISFVSGKDDDVLNKSSNNSGKNRTSFILNRKNIKGHSKIKLWSSILLIILNLIFVPFYSIANTYLIRLEKKKINNSLEKFVSYETLKSSSLKNLYYFFSLFLNKDFLAGYLCLLYIIIHPFVAMKITYGLNFSYCILVLMQILYQSRRPNWDDNSDQKDSVKNNQMIICVASFSNPSIPLFTFIFCTIYSLYSYRRFYAPPRTHMNIILKIILFIIFCSFLITEMIFLIIYRLHYLHELLFTICLAFIMINILIGFENKLQNVIFNATKNFFKLRKNLFKIFLYIFAELVLGILAFNLIGDKFSSYRIEDNIMKSKSCSDQQREEIGLSNSFMDLTYIFCLLGEFWGVSLSLEKTKEEWWYQTEKVFYSRTINREINERNRLDTCLVFLIMLKGILTVIVFFGIWKLFNLIPYVNYLFNFVINCFKYFLLFYTCTGILPILFGYMKLNRKHNISSNKFDEIFADTNSNNLFKASLFVRCFDKSRIPMFTGNKIHYIQILSNEDLDEDDENVDENNFENI